jgi:hypothetical protein
MSCVSVIPIRKIATIRGLKSGFLAQLGPPRREQIDTLARHLVTVGNTGVTKGSVVGRGALPRDEALEDRTSVSTQDLRLTGCGDMRQVIMVMSLTENPRVGGSNPPLGTISLKGCYSLEPR